MFIPLLGAGRSGPSGGAAFSAVYSQTLGLTAALSSTIVTRLKRTGFIATPSGTVTTAKVTIRGPVNRVYIGHAASSGDAYDATSLTQVFFSGGAALTQSTSNSTESDDVAFAWDKTSDIIISMDTDGSTFSYANPGASIADSYYRSSVTQADVADKSSYTGVGGAVYMVAQLRLDGF